MSTCKAHSGGSKNELEMDMWRCFPLEGRTSLQTCSRRRCVHFVRSCRRTLRGDVREASTKEKHISGKLKQSNRAFVRGWLVLQYDPDHRI